MSDILFKFGSYHLPERRHITETDRKHISAVFHQCDAGHKGHLTKEDLKVAVVSLLGYKPTKYEVEEMLRLADEIDGEKCMTLDHFMNVMSSKLSLVDKDDEIRQTFMVFDTQCRGFLTVEDLKKAFSQVAPHIATHRVETAFREVDRDGDGRVSYRDFEFMMKYYLDAL
ncbi:EF-hand calcium-binding domain-containing protein 11-like [Ptychodera flava]|uniref:EF-hand calcium-binding domain-containing protein 11-like n=1 Tax=Ptychodera flava TaxID=63121 RepID=UPI00396A1733